MVGTRNHPKNFPPPDVAVAQASPSTSSPATKSSANATPSRSPASRSKSPNGSAVAKRSHSAKSTGAWSHTPSSLTMAWLYISVPLVIWDTGFVLGRPHTLPGGTMAWLYKPYVLYGKIDKVYGLEFWEAGNGFTGAQSAMNVVETIGYIVYLYILFQFGRPVKGGTTGGARSRRKSNASAVTETIWTVPGRRTLHSHLAGLASLLGFAIACLTASKTLLYAFHELFCGLTGIAHNDLTSLVFLYILPDYVWLVFPLLMIWDFGADILKGLDIASGSKSNSKGE